MPFSCILTPDDSFISFLFARICGLDTNLPNGIIFEPASTSKVVKNEVLTAFIEGQTFHFGCGCELMRHIVRNVNLRDSMKSQALLRTTEDRNNLELYLVSKIITS
ncbi:hypothetical protein N0V93_005097 [Gnomoniopsis smithogilvyi]|uniref:Uncharacterized protein n=1 Tax=Gnomoniopsis smithogilvyi TaxID=1191159 RepID=A0A9W8YUX9_9PEZI|nr:hypothetical protein N0V93_005097 [Gnomoniopsis smithogilvyi]